jgi:hypothetical protein
MFIQKSKALYYISQNAREDIIFIKKYIVYKIYFLCRSSIF